MILRAGDLPDPSYLQRCLDVLSRQPQITFVGSWKRVGSGNDARVDTFPLDAAVELAPFRQRSPLSRYMLRTAPGRLLIDLFPPNAGVWGELAYLWDLDSESQAGLTIPEVLLAQRAEPNYPIEPSTLSYLVLRDRSAWRKGRLARHLVEVSSCGTDPQSHANVNGKENRFLLQRLRSVCGRSVRRLAGGLARRV